MFPICRLQRLFDVQTLKSKLGLGLDCPVYAFDSTKTPLWQLEHGNGVPQPLIEAHAASGPADPPRPPPGPGRKNRARRRGPRKTLERSPPSLPSESPGSLLVRLNCRVGNQHQDKPRPLYMASSKHRALHQPIPAHVWLYLSVFDPPC